MIMLYIFAGFPRTGLSAGGIKFTIDVAEELGIVEQDPNIQCRKTGVYTAGKDGEMLYPTEYRLSDQLLKDGITWDWFPDHFTFGNGVVVHRTAASITMKTVVDGTDLTLDEFLVQSGKTKLAELELERKQVKHDGWMLYEQRWLPGTCPQEDHLVFLTWVLTKYELPEFAYERLRSLIEGKAELKYPEMYSHEKETSHFTEIRKWNGFEPNYAVISEDR